jgi:predicted nucleotidyltransferase
VKRICQKLDEAAKIAEPVRRNIKIAALIGEALREIGQDPVLVGGSAVEFYTQGGYSTADMDFVAPGGPKLVEIMEELGFEKVGKDFVDKARKIYVEFPGSFLGATERANTITIDGLPLKIISVEDLIVDRLCAFKFWKSALDGFNALLLLENGEIDSSRLETRASEESVSDALKIAKTVLEQSIRKKMSREESNRMIERKMKEL